MPENKLEAETGVILSLQPTPGHPGSSVLYQLRFLNTFLSITRNTKGNWYLNEVYIKQIVLNFVYFPSKKVDSVFFYYIQNL